MGKCKNSFFKALNQNKIKNISDEQNKRCQGGGIVCSPLKTEYAIRPTHRIDEAAPELKAKSIRGLPIYPFDINEFYRFVKARI